MKTFIKQFYCYSILCVLLISCSKKNEEIRAEFTDTAYDTYIGKRGDGVEYPHNFLQLKLEPDGSLLTLNSNNELAGIGRWQINGAVFTGQFNLSDENRKISLSGTYDPAKSTITGSWGYGAFSVCGGSFYLQKQPGKMISALNTPVDILLNRF
ncbi:MAG: hypothetical protein EOP53_17520 [Sphingobacteriales bacterium]|nr:MAG: hypothetical protein EOP53_17520 [Sphingobacteriales bacterium]